MRIAFYAPFKPLDHPNPSGDLAIAQSIYGYLSESGHDVFSASRLRTRLFYRKPGFLLSWIIETTRLIRSFSRRPPDLWLTYHTYYKSPDVLGPRVTRTAGVPYAIFQGMYATKYRKRWATAPGFYLNRAALTAARHVFTNRLLDLRNLRRLLPETRVCYIPPGIDRDRFDFDEAARTDYRRRWGIIDTPVILSAAMLRPDVKSRGIDWTIRTCGRLAESGTHFLLVVAGDGRERNRLETLAQKEIPGRYRFLGKIPRETMNRIYSAADLFVFPGIRESLGMVYLEAQSCGLPVVAFDNGGIPEVVLRNETALLTPPFDMAAFAGAVKSLMENPDRRRRMGEAARANVALRHDPDRNFSRMAKILEAVARGGGRNP